MSAAGDKWAAKTLFGVGRKDLILPTIHGNGTSKDALIEQLTEAGQALVVAIRKLTDAGPNGRDYYPQGPSALKRAMGEHEDRLKRLRSVYDELMQLAEGIDELP